MDSLIEPFMPIMISALMFFYQHLGHSFVISLALLTIIVRLLTVPLMLPMQKSSRKQAEIQPQIKAIRKKYAKNQQKQNEELMKLYREAGINPMGGCLPMLIQLPLMFAFYRAIVQALAFKPGELFFGLGKYIASNVNFSPLVPLNSRFLWLDLATPDKTYILPILVGLTTWLSQKLSPTAASGGDDQAQAMSQSMMLTMPLMFAFITINYASGLALYFIISNLVGMVIQYFINRALPMPQLATGAAGKPARVAIEEAPKSEPRPSQAGVQSRSRARSASKRKGKRKRRKS